MTAGAPPRRDDRSFFWIPLCLLANAAIVFAVVQSPYGSLGFFDDTPTTRDWALPMALGAASGLLQGLAFGWRTALVASGLTLVGGAAAFLFVYPTSNTAIGAAIGAAAALMLNRWRARAVRIVAMVVLAAAASTAAVYGSVDHTPEPLPLVEVVTSVDGPDVLLDQERRVTSTFASGTLADVDGCLGLVEASVGRGTLLLVLPPHTVVSSTPFTVTIDGAEYHIGDEVVVPGGGLLTKEIDLEAYRPDLPESCTAHDLFL